MDHHEVDCLLSVSHAWFHPIIDIDTEEELFKTIALVSNVWFERSINSTLLSWTPAQTFIRRRGGRIPLLNVTNEMAEHPFQIASAMVDLLHQWSIVSYSEDKSLITSILLFYL